MPFWRAVIVVAVVLAAVGASVAGAARSGSFRDEFTSFDTRQWLTVSRPFGHGSVDSANVAVANGLLGVKLPADTLNGGEMRSTSLSRYGSYRARMKIANAPTSLTAFFLMYLFANAWFPSWLAGERPTTDRFTYVDWIEHVAR